MENPRKSAEFLSLSNLLSEGIDSGKIKVPILPRVAGQVLQLTNNTDAEMEDFSRLIHTDQALASHVLRIANSAAFSRGTQIISLKQAVARLGMRLLAEIAVAISVQQQKNFVAKGFEEQQRLMMRKALISATYGKEMARTKRRNVEGQFICGLLHTVGEPVTLALIVQIAKVRKLMLTKQEMDSLIADFHPTVGKTMTADWNLPELIVTTCNHYRNYKSAPNYQIETGMTYLSDVMANWVINEEAEERDSIVENETFYELNFYPDEIDALLQKRSRVLTIVDEMEI